MTEKRTIAVPERTQTKADDIPCITQDPTEPAGQQYRAVCTIRAALMATSRYCPTEDGACGGHPICPPCYDLARREGLVQ